MTLPDVNRRGRVLKLDYLCMPETADADDETAYGSIT